MARLGIEHVSLRFQTRRGADVTALEDLSLEIPDKEFAVIVGPSGCGKSSLLYLLAGLHMPTLGHCRIGDSVINGSGADRGMVFQGYTLFPWLSVQKNVEFGLSLSGMPVSERAAIARRFIADVGLDGFAEAYPNQLSGGMRQRVALARALANDPEVLLMDEPFGALDSQTRAIMQELLLKVWEQNHKTVLFVTHDIDEALLLGDRVYVMSARPGRIIETIDVEIERPRSVEVITSQYFVEQKRRVLGLLHDEVLQAMQAAPI